MTTDFTSATILGNKNTTTEKLSFSTQKHIDKNNMFDSLLTNATKSYTTKDVTKSTSNYFTSKEYASKTKNVDSAKTEKFSTVEKTKASRDFDNNNSINEKETFNTNKTNNDIDNKTDSTTKTDIEANNNNEVKEDRFVEKETNIAETEEQQKAEPTEKNESSVDKECSESNKLENKQKEDPKQDLAIENEKTTSENSNKVINEQILANVELIESYELNTNLVAQTTQNEKLVVVEQQPESNIENDNTTIASKINTETQNNILNNIVENITNEKLNAAQTQITPAVLSDTTEQQQVAKEILLTNNSNILQTSELEVNTNLIKNSLEKESVTKDLAQKLTQDATTQNSGVTTKTVQENLAADNARITLNIENDVQQNTKTSQIQEKIAITPSNTIEEQVESQIPTIKVTEEVATQVEANFANLSQNKDYTGEIKSKAAAKLGELQGTSTVVTEVQTSTSSSTQNNSQTNLGQNNNSSIQNNATEQIAKLSVEDATTSADSFLSKLEAKINGTSKVANAQNTTLNKSDIMSQMNAKFSEMQQAGQNKVSIILQPENLGKVSVEIMNSKDGIVAKMTTDNQQVKELFDKNVEALRTSLSAQGVNVNSIKVECTHDTSNNSMNFEREQFNQNFNNSSNNNSNNQTQHSNNSESTYSTEYNFGEEATEETEIANEIKNTETIIKHDGKVDYKV